MSIIKQFVKKDLKPSKWDDDETWDSDWAKDWYKIEMIFDHINELENLFKDIEKPFTYQQSEEVTLLNLKRYTISLSKIIEQKYD